MRSALAAGALGAALLAGCVTPEYALVGGQRVARPTVGYDNGTTFRIVHKRAFPGVFDPARGRDVDDGTLIGRVCGVDIRFDASWFGKRLVLQGTGDVPWMRDFTHTEGQFRMDLEVTELGPGHRHILGRGSGESSEIDLDVSPERLVGTIGLNHFTLAADGDYLLGRYRRNAEAASPTDAPFAIYGRQALGTMVPADEALLLVMMLACHGPALVLDGQKLPGFSLVKLRQ